MRNEGRNEGTAIEITPENSGEFDARTLELPEGAHYSALPQEAKRGLASLPKTLADLIGARLAAVALLIDVDPEQALAHARVARAKASRLPVVRETAGLAAYHAGEWAEALNELRAARRMSGSNEYIAVIADCERALGRPERAIELAKQVRADGLTAAEAVELRIVVAGARRDLGQIDAAIVTLQGDDVHPDRRDPWSARLFYAYADNLAAAGRVDEAVSWFLHAAAADVEGETDAEERAVALAAGVDPSDVDASDVESVVDIDVEDDSGEPVAESPSAIEGQSE